MVSTFPYVLAFLKISDLIRKEVNKINTLDIAALLSIEGVGRKTVLHILNDYMEQSIDINDIKEILHNKIKKISLKEIQEGYQKSHRLIEWAQRSSIDMISIIDERYPKALRKIKDPPLLLFIKGEYEFIYNEKACIGVIGSRQPTKHGKEISKMVSGYLAKKNKGVISGLALGCDTYAHKGCLEFGGKTAAVVAHGLNMIYPYENKRLAQEIISQGGCIISEYFPDERPKNYCFIERDRIQSGLSQGVIVIETEETGGTMHTVKFAQNQKKKIGCIKYPSFFEGIPQLIGNKKIIDNMGGTWIRSYRDIDSFMN